MKTAVFSQFGITLFFIPFVTVSMGAHFQGLGDFSGGIFESSASGISADGSMVVGQGTTASGSQAFYWTRTEGMVGLGVLPGNSASSAKNASADGSVIIGHSYNPSDPLSVEAFRYTKKDGMVSLGDLPGGNNRSFAEAISADGSVIVGMSNTALANEAFKWTQATGMQPLGDLPGGNSQGWAYGISADGSVIVGDSSSSLGIEAFRWTNSQMTGLGDLPGSYFNSHAYSVSANGLVIVGWGKATEVGEAFRWTQETGMVKIGVTNSTAYDVSGDGSIVVGDLLAPYRKSHAFLWDQTNGFRYLQNVLTEDYGLNLTGWQLKSARAISDDGTVITGYGTNPNGDTEAWVALLPEPATLLLLGIGGLMIRKR